MIDRAHTRNPDFGIAMEKCFFKSQIEEENLACFCTELNGTMKNYQLCEEIWNFDEKKNLTPLPDYISDFM